jgi:hypothetical protein
MNFVPKMFFDATRIVAFLATTFIVTPGHAAVSVVLECNSATASKNDHELFELDYDARTVRVHAVDDDGAPAADEPSDRTYPIQVADNEIVWSEYETGDGGYWRDRLGRYSGTLTVEVYDPNVLPNAPHIASMTCQPYSPNRQKKF